MSGGSSNGAGWSTRLEPVRLPDDFRRRADDPRLGEVVEFWQGDPAALQPGRAVLVGFPQDEGVRRNHGRPGAAEAPAGDSAVASIDWPPGTSNARSTWPTSRRSTPATCVFKGTWRRRSWPSVRSSGGILRTGAVPVILGGGHETAYGHYLGYVAAGLPVGILNIDAHLDLRPCIDGRGHSGSPFRQALEHPNSPLPGDRYTCLGVQPHTTSLEHWRYGKKQQCTIDLV